MDPETFDILVRTLENEETFHNHSQNSQMPVDRHVLLALIRFASYGDEALMSKISALCGVGTGTVDLVTRRVIQAIQSSNLRVQHIRWPTGQEKEAAKDWVEEQAGLSAWRGGFCMVNGTSIPLYQQPSYDGGTFEDSSINLQIINAPNRHIVDYGSGVRGSRHDDQCFQSMRVGQRQTELLDEDEWCWADQGYHLTKWLILPYEQPADQVNDNRVFNHHLSKIRIPCEQTIGYLRGRFQSLKELRIRIRKEKDLDYAVAWINTCIVLHAFCMDQELDIDQEWLKDGQEFERGLRTRSALPDETTQPGGSALDEGKEAREDLKSLLLEALG